jgi:hypothetical protein
MVMPEKVVSYRASDGTMFEDWGKALHYEIALTESKTQAKFTIYYYDGYTREVFTSLREINDYNIFEYGNVINIENEAALELLTDYFEEYGYTPPSHLGWNIFNEEWQTLEEFKASIEENYTEFYPIKVSVSIGE